MVSTSGLENAKGRSLPGRKDVGRGVHTQNDVLQRGEAHAFSSGAETALYLSSDRTEILFAMKEVMRGVSQPLVRNVPMLRALVKYYTGASCISLFFVYQVKAIDLEDYVDTGWAGGKYPSRKSTSQGLLLFGLHLVHGFVWTQRTTALSSGESEYCGITSGAAGGLMVKEVFGRIKSNGNLVAYEV